MPTFTQHLQRLSCIISKYFIVISMVEVLPFVRMLISTTWWCDDLGIYPFKPVPDGPMTSAEDPAHIAEAKWVYAISMGFLLIIGVCMVLFYVFKKAGKHLRRTQYIRFPVLVLQFLSVVVMTQAWKSINRNGKIGVILLVVEGVGSAYWLTTYKPPSPEMTSEDSIRAEQPRGAQVEIV